MIDERRFNRGLEELGNKATLLSRASLELAVECMQRQTNLFGATIESVEVYCDKHGGRNRYAAMLMAALPDVWFTPIGESMQRSDYRGRWRDTEIRWTFLAKGDRMIASALASMTAKWIRESMMMRLNGFWQSHLPGLSGHGRLSRRR